MFIYTYGKLSTGLAYVHGMAIYTFQLVDYSALGAISYFSINTNYTVLRDASPTIQPIAHELFFDVVRWDIH
ncbi:unnamed protein product [Strongylus vulgaris]|uniref:Uncharacterized protein n=1 Tax=Strongylus vulgaris TaxID=40348 RepID=A0A3P7JM58_STRVU|nr:unnamed protein product [Strongylus vulgaris]